MEKPWLASYQEGVPDEIDPSIHPTLVDLFTTSCTQFANKTAFENLNQNMTYGELREKSMRFAAFLQKQGFQKGDKLGIMLPNLLQYPVAIFGTLLAGGVVVNINPLYTADELVYQVKDAQMQFLLVLHNLTATVQEAQKQVFIKKIITTQVGDMLSPVKRVLVNCVTHYKMQPRAVHLPEAIKWRQIFAENKVEAYQPVALEPESLAFLQYTGGTTGIAKGAMLTHRNMVANVLQAYTWVKPLGIGEEDWVITALPLYHIFALTANCLVFLKAGAKNSLVTNPRNIKGLVNGLHKKAFTAITGVNTLFNAMLNHPQFDRINFSRVKLALSGGMALQKAVAEAWHKRTQTRILEAYGLTETAPAATINPMYLDDYNGSIGLPLPSTLVSIRDEDARPLPLGTVGELCIKGPQVMKGYWHREEETQAVFTKDGFLKTGDLAKMDEKGFIYLVDRKKDLIIVSGFNVYPNEVEQVIGRHPDVLEVGVVGMLDKTGNERVKAFIVRKNHTLTEAALIAYCRKHLTPYKVPKVVEFREYLPKTNVGKILRRALQTEPRP